MKRVPTLCQADHLQPIRRSGTATRSLAGGGLYPVSTPTTLHCTTLHYTTLHFTTLQVSSASLHFTSLHFTSLHYTMYYTTLYYTTLHYTALYCTTLHFTTLHYTTLHCSTLHYTSLQLHFTKLHCTTLHYTALHYIAVQYTTVNYSSTLHYTTPWLPQVSQSWGALSCGGTGSLARVIPPCCVFGPRAFVLLQVCDMNPPWDIKLRCVDHVAKSGLFAEVGSHSLE